eukprot:tig00021072_g17968.t1
MSPSAPVPEPAPCDVPAHRLVEYDRVEGVSRCPLAIGTAPGGRIRFETAKLPLPGDPEVDSEARRRHVEFGTACYLAWRCFQNRDRRPPRPVRWSDECPACLEPVARPVASACGHVLCFACMVLWPWATCPVCREVCPVGGVYFLASEHARLARESPRAYAERLAQEAHVRLGWMPGSFRDRFASVDWMMVTLEGSGGFGLEAPAPPDSPAAGSGTKGKRRADIDLAREA